MKRKMTIFKLLLLIPAFLFGLATYAQKAEPVKQGSVKAAVKVDPGLSSVKSSSWQIEQEIESTLGTQNASAELPQAAPAQAGKIANTYDAEKQAILASWQAAADERANLPAMLVAEATNKLAAAPQTMWDIIFNYGADGSNQPWGIESDGMYIYTTIPYASGYRFSKYSMGGAFIQNFNIPGITTTSIRDLCYDGATWWGIEYSSPCRIHQMDLSAGTLLNTYTLPTTLTYGYHISFDQDLNGNNGGFYLGGYSQLFTCDMTGGTLVGPIASFNSSAGYHYSLGSGIDKYSDQGNTLLWFSGGYTNVLSSYNVVTGAWGTTHTITDVAPYIYSTVYGVSESSLYEPGKLVLMGAAYTSTPSYSLFGYELAYTVSYPTDAGVKMIMDPNSGSNLTSAETVKILVRNYGTQPLASIPVQFSVDGVLSAVETIAGPVLPSTDYLYTFTQTADLHLFNNWQVCAYTLVPGDQFALNNSKCKTVTNNITTNVDTIFPKLQANWTGTVNGNTGTPPITIVENSLMRYTSGGVKGAWAKFPLDSIPSGAVIIDVQLHWYETINVGSPYYQLVRMTSDPVSASATTIWNDLISGYTYNPATRTSHTAIGWQVDNLGGTVIKADISAGSEITPKPWWAVGYHEDETPVGNYQGGADGWNEPNPPYLVITYNNLLPNDVGVKQLLLEPFALAGTALTPQAIIKNYGTTAETFTATMTGPGGYTSTIPVTLAAGAEATYNFASGTFPVSAAATFTCCVSLATDINLFNQCKSQNMTFDAVLTRAYGYVANNYGVGNIPLGPVKFFLEHADYVTSIATNASPLSGGTWGKNPAGNDTWYATQFQAPSGDGNLITINPTTGAYTVIGPLGVDINGITYDYTTGTLYGIASNIGPVGNYATSLYQINRTTGQAVLFANLGYTSGLAINLACNANGMIFFIDIIADKLFAVDPFTYEKEAVGATGVNFSGAQDMEFNRTNGICYQAGWLQTIGSGGLYKCDLATGNSTVLKMFPNGILITALAIPYTQPVSPIDIGVMWLKYPKTGNLTNQEPVMVKIRNYSDISVAPLADFKISYQMGNGPIVTENWATNGYPAFAPGEVIDYSFSSSLLDLSTPGASYCFKAWVWDVAGDVHQVNDTTRKCIKNTSCTLAETCYTGGIQETEVCGDNTNGGCESTPPAYSTLATGSAYCGTVWKTDTIRDMDWYTFTISSTKTIRVVGKAEFGMSMSLVQLPCSSNPSVYTKLFTKCSTDSLVYPNLAPGTYAIVVAPDFNEYDIICGFSDKYTMKFSLLPPRYCAGGGGTYTGSWEYIGNVTFGSINNTTGYAAGGYSDFTNLYTIVEVGQTYPISVLNPQYYSNDYVVAYIDWNNNFSFLEADEKFNTSTPPNISFEPATYTGTVTVPANSTPGAKTMRVRLIDGYSDPCGTYNWSEIEDYTVQVIAPIPTIITTIGSLTQPCPGNKIVPVDVQFFDNIQSVSLNMTVSPGMVLVDKLNLNPALDNGSFNIVQAGNQIIATWFSLTPASIGSGKMFDLELICPAGANTITWVTGPDGSQYANQLMGNLDAQWIGATLTFGNCANLTGKTYYAHKSITGVFSPILMGNNANCDSISVYLMQGNVVVDSTCPDASGNYSFTNLDNGNYTLKSVPHKKWGGCNSADANAIMRNFVHLNNFYLAGIYLNAADVNGSPISNPIGTALDALLVTKRFVNIIPTFLPGTYNGTTIPPPGRVDWASESFPITVTGTANQVKDILTLCTGDVNGTYSPYGPPKSTVIINNEGSITAQSDVIDLPIYAENAMSLGSASIVLSYPASLQILDVTVGFEAENLVYTATNGHLRMAWFGLDPMELKAGDILATLKINISKLNGSASFTNTIETELTDVEGMRLENANLAIPKIVNAVNADDYTLNNVPNPFNTTTEIRYYLPQAGNISLTVYNVLGEEITTLVNNEQSAGNHTVTFDGASLPRGVYMYKLQAGSVTLVKTMVITE